MRKFIKTVLFLILTMFGCNLQIRQIEKNIESLNSAKARLLVNPNDDEALNVMINMLKDRNVTNRTNAAGILGQTAIKVGGSIKDKALPPLIKLLDEGDGFDKHAAAQALLAFGENAEPAIPTLRKNLFPSDTSTAYFVAKTLGKIGEPAIVAVPDLLKLIIDNQIDPPTHEHLSRGSATRALGEIGPKAKEAIPEMINLLNNTDNPIFKIQLAVALIRIDANNAEGLSEIENSLHNQDVEIRRKAIWELQDAGAESKPALNLIKTARTDSDSAVRIAAAQLLEVINKS